MKKFIILIVTMLLVVFNGSCVANVEKMQPLEIENHWDNPLELQIWVAGESHSLSVIPALETKIFRHSYIYSTPDIMYELTAKADSNETIFEQWFDTDMLNAQGWRVVIQPTKNRVTHPITIENLRDDSVRIVIWTGLKNQEVGIVQPRQEKTFNYSDVFEGSQLTYNIMALEIQAGMFVFTRTYTVSQLDKINWHLVIENSKADDATKIRVNNGWDIEINVSVSNSLANENFGIIPARQNSIFCSSKILSGPNYDLQIWAVDPSENLLYWRIFSYEQLESMSWEITIKPGTAAH